jgi:hypothetical protein
MLVVMESSAARKLGEPLPQPGQQAPATGRQITPCAQHAGGERPPMPFTFKTFQEIMLNDLIPLIDGNFRTLTNGQNRAMAGLSMGEIVYGFPITNLLGYCDS